MKAHTVTGYINWQDAQGWWHAFTVPPTDIMAGDAQDAIERTATLLFLCFPETTRQGTFHADVRCQGVTTLGTASWEA